MMTEPRRLWFTTSVLSLVAVGLLTACSSPSNASAGLVRTLGGHTLTVTSVAWSPDGKFLAAASDDTTVRIWDAKTGQAVTTLSYGGSALSVAWSPDGKYLAVGFAAKNTVRVTETASWKTIHEWNTGLKGMVTSVAWSPDSKSLAVCTYPPSPSDDGILGIWDLSSKKTIANLIEPSGVSNASWSPDGKLLAFTSTAVPGLPQSRVILWDPSKGGGQITNNNTILVATEKTLVLSLAWSPDGKRLASGSFDSLVKVWDVASKQNTITFTGHAADVQSVEWSLDGKRIASGSWDRTARVWDVPSGKEIAKFTHPEYVNSVAWSPDGKYLATGDHETFNNVFIWEVK